MIGLPFVHFVGSQNTTTRRLIRFQPVYAGAGYLARSSNDAKLMRQKATNSLISDASYKMPIIVSILDYKMLL